MRVGIEASVLAKERSGVGQYVHHLVTGLGHVDQKNEYLLHVLSRGHEFPQLPAYPFANIRFKHLCGSSKIFQLMTGFGRWGLPRRYLPFDSVDVFHWSNFLLLRGVPGKQVITIYDLSFLVYPSYHPWIRVKGLTAGIARSASRADAIIAISEHTKRDLITRLQIPEEKIRVVPCAAASHFRPLDAASRSSILSRYGLPETGYLLYAGNIEPRKNLVRLLRAYSLLKQDGERPLPFFLCGGVGWKNTEIHRCVEQLSLQRDVQFLGYVPDEHLPALMNGATVFLYPSLYEGFGLPPLEAMACGTPVVTSNVSSLPEVVGDAGVMVDPTDVEGLMKAIGRIVVDEELRRDLQRRGLERAKLFSWEATARKTVQVYEEVARQPQS